MRPRCDAASRPVPSSWVDDRLAAEPKLDAQKRRRGISVQLLLRIGTLVLIAYVVRVQDLLFASLTSVACTPATVQAGANVTCDITTSRFASEMGLSITPLGSAGLLTLIADTTRTHRIGFTTKMTGDAGVRVTHFLFFATSVVNVLPGPVVAVDVRCWPNEVAPGSNVKCSVEPRDAFANLAEVERPADAPADFFAVTRIGTAADLVVHDAFVSFVAQAPGQAGVRIILNGRRAAESVVTVSRDKGHPLAE